MFTRVLALMTCAAVVAAAVNNTMYLISNAEVPSFNRPGLTPVGLNRVQNCLPGILAPLDIGLVVSCEFDAESGLCASTMATATPLAAGLGLTVDTTCGADEETDDDCITDLVKDFAKNSTKAVLVVWDLNGFDDLFENLDIDDDFGNEDEDDEDVLSYDLFYTVVKKKVVGFVSQNCTGIDGQAAGTFRRRRGVMKERRVDSRIVGRGY